MDAFTKDDVRAFDHESGCAFRCSSPPNAGHQTEQTASASRTFFSAPRTISSLKVRRQAVALLAEANAYLSDAHFWRSQSDGLAVFVSPTVTQVPRALHQRVRDCRQELPPPARAALPRRRWPVLPSRPQPEIRTPAGGSRDSIEE